MKGFVFSLDVLLAIVITIVFLSLIDVTHSPKMGLELHKIAEDSLALLKLDGRIQGLNPSQIDGILNKTTDHYYLEIKRYNKDNTLESTTVIGETIEENAAVAKSTFVDDNYFYRLILAVWK